MFKNILHSLYIDCFVDPWLSLNINQVFFGCKQVFMFLLNPSYQLLELHAFLRCHLSGIVLLVVNCKQRAKSNTKRYFGLPINCSPNLVWIIENLTLMIKIIGLINFSIYVYIPSYYGEIYSYSTSIISMGVSLSQHSPKACLFEYMAN